MKIVQNKGESVEIEEPGFTVKINSAPEQNRINIFIDGRFVTAIMKFSDDDLCQHTITGGARAVIFGDNYRNFQ